ncbi:TetR/AcrR family transcriptional regulator [Sphingobacterium faecium]
MREKKDFILRAIEDAETIFVTHGFQKAKVTDILDSINVSRSTFFTYFGSIYGMMELAIFHQISQCYAIMRMKFIKVEDKEELLQDLMEFRNAYFKNNPMLCQYDITKDFLTKRFDPLKKAIKHHENELIHDFLEKRFFSEDDISYFKFSITN